MKFKTSLNCGNCVSKVKADLDQTVGGNNWNVDTDNPEKVLTINADNINEEDIIKLLKKKGFKAEPIV